MTTHPHSSGTKAQRRHALALPKRRYHVVMAIGVLVGMIALPLWLSKQLGSEKDAEARGAVEITQLPEAEQPTPLDAPAEALPDLLADVVEVGDNPTVALNDTPTEPSSTPRTTDTPTVTRPGRAAIIRPPEPVAPPLDPSLLRQTPAGSVPGPNSAGLTPLDAYAAQPVPTNGKASVSLIVGGLGVNAELTRRAIRELPASVTLSFAAQSDGLQDWINEARAFGHETLLEVPMEGQTSGSSETLLRTNIAPEINRRRLQSLLSNAQGYIGITPYQGDVFLTRSDALSPVLAELKASELAFFTDGVVDAPSLSSLAQTLELPFKSGFGQIDPVASEKVIEARLNGLAKAATDRAGLIGVGFAYPQTIDAVRRWARNLEDNNLILVPASQTLGP